MTRIASKLTIFRNLGTKYENKKNVMGYFNVGCPIDMFLMLVYIVRVRCIFALLSRENAPLVY